MALIVCTRDEIRRLLVIPLRYVRHHRTVVAKAVIEFTSGLTAAYGEIPSAGLDSDTRIFLIFQAG